MSLNNSYKSSNKNRSMNFFTTILEVLFNIIFIDGKTHLIFGKNYKKLSVFINVKLKYITELEHYKLFISQREIRENHLF